MNRRILRLSSIIIILVILLSTTVYADNSNSFERYQNAQNLTTSSDSSGSGESESSSNDSETKNAGDTTHKRVISVVYDNSWSTSGYKSERWSYINYAFQFFVSMLDKNDSLFVTTTSKYNKTQQLDLSGDRQSVVDNVRKEFFDNGGTEIQSLYTAYSKLSLCQDKDANTEYWLFIFTDGEFYHDSYMNTVSAEELKQMLDDCADEIMPNGTKLNVACLTIGSDSRDLGKSDKDNVLLSHTQTDDGVIPSIIDICTHINKVTDTKNVSYLDWKKTGNNTIEVDAKHQVKDLYILSQKSSAKITSIKRSGNEKSEISKQANIYYPSEIGYVTNRDLNGSISVFNAGQSFFDSDIYTITFDQPISENQISVLFTPLLDIDIGLYLRDSDTVINPKLKYYQTDQIRAAYRVYDSGTGRTVDLQKYFQNTSYLFQLLDGTNVVAKNDSSNMMLDNLPVVSNPVIFDATVKIDDAQTLTHKLLYTPNIYSGYKIVPRDNNMTSILRTDLLNNNKSLYFDVYKKGKKLTRDDLLTTKFDVDFNNKFKCLKSKTNICADGSICVTPYFISTNKIVNTILNFSPTIFLGTGELSVTCGLSDKEIPNVTGTARVQVNREPMIIIIKNILELLILITIILGYVFKERFYSKSKVYMSDNLKISDDIIISGINNWKYKMLSSKNSLGLVLPTGRSTFLPFARNQVDLGDIVFKAKGFSWDKHDNRCIIAETTNNAMIVGKIIFGNSISTTSVMKISKSSRKIELFDHESYCDKITLEYGQGIIVKDSENNFKIYKAKYYDEYVFNDEVTPK